MRLSKLMFLTVSNKGILIFIGIFIDSPITKASPLLNDGRDFRNTEKLLGAKLIIFA